MGMSPDQVDEEIVDALAEDEHIGSLAHALVTYIIGGHVIAVHGWGFALLCLEDYRHNGGTLSCPLYAPAAAVRAVMARMADQLESKAQAMMAGEPDLADRVAGDVARIRAAIDAPP